MTDVASSSTFQGASAKQLSRLERNEKLILFAFLLPTLALLAVFFFYPMLSFLAQSIFDPDFTLKHFEKSFGRPVYLRILWKTLKVSAWTTVSCFAIGYPVAFVMAHATGKTKITIVAFVLIPFWTSVLVRMFAWMALLGRDGVINRALIHINLIDQPLEMLFTQFAVLVGMVHYMLPYMILPIFAVMMGIPRNLMDAAANLGAPPHKVFWRVYFPLSLPGIGAGGLLVFIISMGFYVTPALLGGAKDVLLAQIIEQQISDTLNWGFAAALSVILLTVTIVLFFLYDRLISPEKIYGGE
ncbi:MAG: ABC transporter permease [Proteobacteria bacterium]|nr:ABC transporter permease [Pseudomonadota bacterium]